ncbi:MAG TPA: hypothetical protein VNX28_18275 [Gemmataceae bacterium]|jgi:hypothetical protein|nr:hypothetical protein [Gemmataceae bacterium]
MNRLAVFVEGYTEVIFVTRLLEEIAGEKHVRIEWRKIQGGTKTKRSSALVRAAKPDTGQMYYVLVFDCGGDRLVKPRIVEEHANLTRKGYQRIIGLRDVRPDYSHTTMGDLLAMLKKYVKTSLIPVDFILAVLEIEAWFLSETKHFAIIDPAITVSAIKAALGFDPEHDDMQQRLMPAEDLSDCYAIGGKVYEKHNAQLTVNALQFEHVYMGLVNKLAPLKRLVEIIEEFLAS